jgi:hemerythrin-like domain-containing protein
MKTIDRCRSAHTELRELIGDLRPRLSTEKLRNISNARDTHELLCDLRERMLRHFDDEDRRLYPGLLVHDDPKAKMIAWNFISSESPLRMMFDNYHQEWLKNSDYNFCDTFVSETQQVCDLVAMRLDHEEQVLFPQAVEINRLREG